MEWHVKSKCLDLIWHHDILYLACQDALYELEMAGKKGHTLHDDNEEEDFFQLFETSSTSKKKCVLPDNTALKVQNALLKVKFKREAICFCHDTSNEILYSLHSKGNSKAYYVEATDLKTFQCSNPSLCIIDTPDGQARSSNLDRPWMLVDGRSFFIFVNHCYRGRLNESGRNCSSINLEQVPGKIRLKIDLFLDGWVSRPRYAGNDLLEKILDEKQSQFNCDDQKEEARILRENFQDFRFISHEQLVVLTSEGTLVEYRKDGGKISKVNIPSTHVTLITSKANILYFVTRYGSVYSVDTNHYYQTMRGMTYNDNEETDLTDMIIKSSRDLQILAAKQKEKAATLQQLKLAVASAEDCIRLKTQVIVDFNEADNGGGMLILTLTNTSGSELLGRHWSFHLSFGCQGVQKIFPLPMKVLAKGAQWSLKVMPVKQYIALEDLPIRMTFSLVFSHSQGDNNLVNISTSPWHYTLTSLDFIQWRSSLADGTLVEADEAMVSSSNFDTSDMNLRSLIRQLNRKKISSDGLEHKIATDCSSDMPKVIVNLCLNEKLKDKHRLFKELEETFACKQRTHYIDLLGIRMSLHGTMESTFLQLTIRTQYRQDLNYALQLKKDLLTMGRMTMEEQHPLCDAGKEADHTVIRTVKSALASIDFVGKQSDEADNNAEMALQRCYQLLRSTHPIIG